MCDAQSGEDPGGAHCVISKMWHLELVLPHVLSGLASIFEVRASQRVGQGAIGPSFRPTVLLLLSALQGQTNQVNLAHSCGVLVVDAVGLGGPPCAEAVVVSIVVHVLLDHTDPLADLLREAYASGKSLGMYVCGVAGAGGRGEGVSACQLGDVVSEAWSVMGSPLGDERVVVNPLDVVGGLLLPLCRLL